MARKTLRHLIERAVGTEWDRLLRRLRNGGKRHVLICWNRGLGDVALGLYPVIDELRRAVPGVSISILTRSDLAEAFTLLDIDELIVDPLLRRRDAFRLEAALPRLDVNPERFDAVLKRPDPTHWIRNLPSKQPRLGWPLHCEGLSARFDEAFGDAVDDARRPLDIGVHLQSETGHYYRYRKDWPVEQWRALFDEVAARHDVRFVLFGHVAAPAFEGPGFVDLRGKTSLLEMLAVIKDRCRMLIAPDSGVLTMSYYLDVQTPLDVISLWADPRQGVLKRNVASPNPLLRHRPLRAPDEQIERLTVETVAAAVDEMLADRPERSTARQVPRRAIHAQ